MARTEGAVTPGLAAEDPAPDEPRPLIAAGKVAGTPVFGQDGGQLGTIEDVMLDKRSGRVAYAVMSFGGFLGFGERFHPLPWSVLRYDTARGGYAVDLDPDRLRDAPAYTAAEMPDWSGGDWGRRVDDYWGARSIWGAPGSS
ncbi:PRC-barrel domain-containing protein [Paracraurococcus lichenis]|uniref:PRC-barrel domain-containing protein n=1 Tax=Paracraurococcus lichenis TaxID=3064888 RepID=A0ABT9E1C4_9PROT|nr:PRC-barrel domain-containing protein [Paracraurococcus sp. LOR1-02]MDO9709971.1 PRC-barrel domain-containing protein [Paracraurococcus sp. LOR1-02]